MFRNVQNLGATELVIKNIKWKILRNFTELTFSAEEYTKSHLSLKVARSRIYEYH